MNGIVGEHLKLHMSRTVHGCYARCPFPLRPGSIMPPSAYETLSTPTAFAAIVSAGVKARLLASGNSLQGPSSATFDR
jgi:hypothetical protein